LRLENALCEKLTALPYAAAAESWPQARELPILDLALRARPDADHIAHFRKMVGHDPLVLAHMMMGSTGTHHIGSL
jgi:hypothetical protein